MNTVLPAARAVFIGLALVGGRYQLNTPGGDILELRADGAATLAGDRMRWTVRGTELLVGNEVMVYQMQGDTLLLKIGTVVTTWKRLAGPAAATPAPALRPGEVGGVGGVGVQGTGLPPQAASAPSAGGDAMDQQARALLTSTAWCSFTYSQTSGTSTTRRVVFRADGVMLVNDGRETYNSGPNGTVSGQSGSNGAMRWRLENQRLLVDPADGRGYQDVQLTATRNSSGSVILNSLGREYGMCR